MSMKKQILGLTAAALISGEAYAKPDYQETPAPEQTEAPAAGSVQLETGSYVTGESSGEATGTEAPVLEPETPATNFMFPPQLNLLLNQDASGTATETPVPGPTENTPSTPYVTSEVPSAPVCMPADTLLELVNSAQQIRSGFLSGNDIDISIVDAFNGVNFGDNSTVQGAGDDNTNYGVNTQSGQNTQGDVNCAGHDVAVSAQDVAGLQADINRLNDLYNRVQNDVDGLRQNQEAYSAWQAEVSTVLDNIVGKIGTLYATQEAHSSTLEQHSSELAELGEHLEQYATEFGQDLERLEQALVDDIYFMTRAGVGVNTYGDAYGLVRVAGCADSGDTAVCLTVAPGLPGVQESQSVEVINSYNPESGNTTTGNRTTTTEIDATVGVEARQNFVGGDLAAYLGAGAQLLTEQSEVQAEIRDSTGWGGPSNSYDGPAGSSVSAGGYLGVEGRLTNGVYAGAEFGVDNLANSPSGYGIFSLRFDLGNDE